MAFKAGVLFGVVLAAPSSSTAAVEVNLNMLAANLDLGDREFFAGFGADPFALQPFVVILQVQAGLSIERFPGAGIKRKVMGYPLDSGDPKM